MNCKAMLACEPELAHIERSCRAAKQQGANWHDLRALAGVSVMTEMSCMMTRWPK